MRITRRALSAAFLEAARISDTAKVRRLLARGADVNAFLDDRDPTALCRAVRCGNEGMVRLLLQYHADTDAKTGATDDTPLMIAIRQDNKPIFDLLASRASIDAKNAEGQTPVHIAVAARAYEILESLLGSRAEWGLADKKNLTPLALAAKLGDYRAMDLLLDKVPRDYFRPAPSVNYFETGGFTALHASAVEGRTDVIRDLLRRGAYVRAVDDYGWTPLHFACHWNHLDAAQLLLDEGALAWARTRYGASPLVVSAANFADDTVKLLLRTLKDEFDPHDPTPKFLERMSESRAAVLSEQFRTDVNEALRAASVSLDLSPLSFRERQPIVITSLLDAGADPDAQGSDGRSAWDIANANKSEVALELFKGRPTR